MRANLVQPVEEALGGSAAFRVERVVLVQAAVGPYTSVLDLIVVVVVLALLKVDVRVRELHRGDGNLREVAAPRRNVSTDFVRAEDTV